MYKLIASFIFFQSHIGSSLAMHVPWERMSVLNLGIVVMMSLINHKIKKISILCYINGNCVMNLQ